jgi:hypothetical protein
LLTCWRRRKKKKKLQANKEKVLGLSDEGEDRSEQE